MLLPFWLLSGLSFVSSALGAAVDLGTREDGGNHLVARSFGLTVSGSSYIVDTNAGLIFTVDNTNCGKTCPFVEFGALMSHARYHFNEV